MRCHQAASLTLADSNHGLDIGDSGASAHLEGVRAVCNSKQSDERLHEHFMP